MISYIDNTKNVVTEIPITIAASSWSSSAPYTYTWTDSRVLSGSSVEVDILSTSTDTSAVSVDYTKAAGSITFTASAKPVGDIAVNICIINARADLGSSISADTVATDVISGASNVGQALSALNSKINPAFAWQANVDCNSLTTPGWYAIQSYSANGPSNSAADWSIMNVFGRYDTIRQIIYGQRGTVFTRSYQANAWSAWQELALNSNIASFGIPEDVRTQLTPSKCTINTAGMSLINKLVTYYLDFTTSQAVSVQDEIITGLKTPIGTANNVQYITATNASAPSDQKHFLVRDGGKIMALDALGSSKRYRATFTYYTN